MMRNKEENVPLLRQGDKGQGRQRWKKIPKGGIKILFAFASRKDLCYMLTGIMGSVVSSIARPLFFIFIGAFFSSLIDFTKKSNIEMEVSENGSNSSATDALQSSEKSDLLTAFMTLAIYGTIVSTCMFIGKFFQRYLCGISAVHQVERLRSKYFKRIMAMDLSWIEQKNAAQITLAFENKSVHILETISDSIPMTIGLIFGIISTYLTAIIMAWDTSLLACTMMPIALIAKWFQTKHKSKFMPIEQALLEKASSVAHDCFSCISTVIAFNGQKQTIQRYKRNLTEAMSNSRQSCHVSSVLLACNYTAFRLIGLIGMWYGIATLAPGADAGALLAVILLLCSSSHRIPALNMHLARTLRAMNIAKQLHQMLSQEPTIEVGKGERPRQTVGIIEFQNVSFAYPTRPNLAVLKNVSFSINGGQKLAIVGESGSGKSTIASLLLRFYDPTEGRILLDGTDIRELNVQWLRQQLGFVSQEPVLFDMTIEQNLRLAKKDIERPEIESVLHIANALKFVNDLPDGLHTRVGERGSHLSGGQKQRLAIARALMTKPKVLMFDEATSALDNESEAAVQKCIDNASMGRTTVTIAHRLSTISNSDYIMVLENGEIVEQGTPKALVEARGPFLQMLNASFPSPQVTQQLFQQQEMLHQTIRESESEASTSSTVVRSRKQSCSTSDADELKQHLSSEAQSEVEDLEEAKSQKFRMDGIAESGSSSDAREVVVAQRKSKSNWSAFYRIMKRYREGHGVLCAAILALTLRGLLFNTWSIFLAYENSLLTITNKEEQSEKLMIAGLAWLACTVMEFGVEILSVNLWSKYADGLSSYLRVEMLQTILRNNLSYFEEPEHSLNVLSNRIGNDAATIRIVLTGKMRELATILLMFFAAYTFAFAMNFYFTLICSWIFAGLVLGVSFELRRTQQKEKQLKPAEQEAATLISQAFTNIRTVKAFSMQTPFLDMYKECREPVMRHLFAINVTTAMILALQNCILVIYLLSVNLLCEYYISNSLASLFVCWSIMFTIKNTYVRMGSVKSSLTDVARSLVSANMIDTLLSETPEMDVTCNMGIKPELSGSVALRVVNFKYPSRPDCSVLKSFSIRVKAGSTAALVGPSGCGKSTVIKLIERLYDAHYGHVSLDGYDVRDLNLQYLHSKVVPVNQEPVLFDFTIWENIVYGLEPDQYSRETIVDAAKAANIHNFVMTLPAGYNAEVGALGSQLSGGQKQRIAIARALVREPVFLILDEATAALDSQNEQMVQDALENAQHKCTCIVVAHRLSTITNADMIFVLADGRVVEKGSDRNYI